MSKKPQTSSRTYRLSLMMIIKNEAKNLKISLPSVAGWADEIIVLDSGSTDNSQAIVEQYGGKFFTNTDWQGFGIQRQRAQKLTTGDWILVLDADEQVTPKLKKSIEKAISNLDQTVYGIRRLDYLNHHLIDNPHWLLPIKAHWRLYPKEHFQYHPSLVHESLDCKQAKRKILTGYLNHYTASSPQIYLNKWLKYAQVWGEKRHSQEKQTSFTKMIIHSGWSFIFRYWIQGRFLKGRYALLFCTLLSQYTFNKYASLHLLNKEAAQSLNVPNE